MALSEFAEWFCMTSDRTFSVQPDRDPEFYFGRGEIAEGIKKRLDRGILLHGAPKLVLWGAFGAGKTHTLHHIKWYLEQHPKEHFEVRYVETPPDLGRRSKYTVLHQAMMDKIGQTALRTLLEGFINKNIGPNLEDALQDFFGHDADVVNVARVVAQRGPQALTAWKWLRGEGLTDAQLQAIGVARNPNLQDLITILTSVGRLYREVDDSRLVFLIDELEQLEYVTGEEIGTWETGFRKLAEGDNVAVGFVFAARAPAGDELASPLRHDAFRTRITDNNFIEIPYLADVEDVDRFVKDLVAHLIDTECATKKLLAEQLESPLDLYPFTPEAIELIAQYIYEDPTRALPRELLFTLNECGAAAVGTSVLITEEVANEVLY